MKLPRDIFDVPAGWRRRVAIVLTAPPLFVGVTLWCMAEGAYRGVRAELRELGEALCDACEAIHEAWNESPPNGKLRDLMRSTPPWERKS